MNREEYKEFQDNFSDFFKSEGITNLTDDSEEPYFSWRSCECCGTPLGGDRYHATGYNPTTNGIQEYEVCQDCVYYAEYGQLDDMTMMDMED
jgi:hypothetical protein